MLGRGSTLALAATAACLALHGTGTAQAMFSPAATVSPAGGSILHDPTVAIDSNDRAMVVWVRYLAEDDIRVESIYLMPDGTTEPVRTLAFLTTAAWSPHVALDREGRATVVWYGGSGGHRIQSVRVSAEGVPGPVTPISGLDAREPRIAMDSDGRATVAWHRGGGQSLAVDAVRLSSDGVPGPVRTLSVPGEGGFLPRLAVDALSRVTAVWAGGQAVQAVRIEPDGTPGAVRDLSPGGQLPDVTVDRAGRATVVWQQDLLPGESTGPEDTRRIKSIRIAADGSLGTARTVSGAGQARSPAIATDPFGGATVAWQDQAPARVRSAPLSDDGSPLVDLDLSGPLNDTVGGPGVVADSCGATVSWSRSSGGIQPSGLVQAVRITQGASPATPITIASDDSGGYGGPYLAADSRNRVVATWVHFADNASSVQVSGGPPLDCSRNAISGTISPGPQARRNGRLGLRRRGTIVAGRIVLRATCPRGNPCRGRLRVVVLGRLSPDRPRQSLVLGRLRYQLAPASTQKLRVPLSKTGRTWLAARRTPTIRVRVFKSPGARRGALVRLRIVD